MLDSSVFPVARQQASGGAGGLRRPRPQARYPAPSATIRRCSVLGAGGEQQQLQDSGADEP